MKTAVIEVRKPQKAVESSLKIAHIAVKALNKEGFHEQAVKIGLKITGQTPVKKAYQITGRYIEWTPPHENY